MQDEGSDTDEDKSVLIPAPPTPQSSCWRPLSSRHGFPRAFSLIELEMAANGFGTENLILEEDGMKLYEGIYQETPILIRLFSGDDDRFWSLLKVLSCVRHRNIVNLVGYCCTADSLFLLCDYPCNGNELAKNLLWKTRWYIALEIGAGLRYLREDCADGPIIDLSICSSAVVFSHSSTAMLSMFKRAKWLKGDLPCNEDSPADLERCTCPTIEEDERLLADLCGYGMFLIELITGKSAQTFQEQGEGQSLVDWALPFLENGSLDQVMDPRIEDTSDIRVVDHIAQAALLCLKNDSCHRFSMSEVLAVARGDKFAIAKY
ncbi:unnamed protein product [Ilex paraguariensis]|uniref:Protein kinase domain-containing protein n=1 Tax=Ilex paraguariensis TaxID=185542 RepID=A0ABC8UCM2_9AQUA